MAIQKIANSPPEESLAGGEFGGLEESLEERLGVALFGKFSCSTVT